ncbi:MAG: hypothetical protein ABR573_00015 [Candidatus Dormibacteria bacterium]
MARSAITKTLSLTAEDAPRFERLVRRFGHGSTTEWVRVAMDRMETAEIAEELSDLRLYGQKRARAKGVEGSDVHDAVRRTLNR